MKAVQFLLNTQHQKKTDEVMHLLLVFFLELIEEDLCSKSKTVTG